tara:strand:- start:176 stop:1621 length:1446 start_codon:yes stop_codon:yes gene_type:complete
MSTETVTAAEREPLDRVMLAMDVVDTLRHQQQLVASELDEDARSRDFTLRVKRIYDAQGIDVDEQIIAEAVEALREDRFVYKPPSPTLAVRVARIYVERGKWALRVGLLALVLVSIWGTFAFVSHQQRQGLIEDFTRRIDATLRQAQQMSARSDTVAKAAAAADSDLVAWQLQLQDAREKAKTGRARAERVIAALTPKPQPETYPDEPEHWDAVVTAQRETLASADSELDAADRLLDNITDLRRTNQELLVAQARISSVSLTEAELSEVNAWQTKAEEQLALGDAPAAVSALRRMNATIDEAVRARQQIAAVRTEFARLRGALAGVEVEAAAQTEREQLHAVIEQALAAGDLVRARDKTERLAALVEQLDQTYELRIVQDGQSGVWRYHAEDRSIRNYYIVVQAIGANGRPLRLSIESEEDGRTRAVSKFAIRVPEAVYERVKADKLDNRIVDDRLFGSKLRGRRKPVYRFDVAGGWITRW